MTKAAVTTAAMTKAAMTKAATTLMAVLAAALMAANDRISAKRYSWLIEQPTSSFFYNDIKISITSSFV